MKTGRGIALRIAVGALLVALAAAGMAFAAGRGRSGSADPTFGKGGRVVVSLPPASGSSWFGPIAPAAGGRLLVAYHFSPDRESEDTTIERRNADGTLDRSFGKGGSVKVDGIVSALAEDPAGGVVYGGYGWFGRLGPDGAEDQAFDARAGREIGEFGARTIAFDAAGRIVAGGSYAPGARYHPHEDEAAVLRFAPDGTPDPTFGSAGAVFLSGAGDGGGELGLLPDGSMLVVGADLTHLAAGGTVLPTPGTSLTGEPTLAVFPDGSFAVADRVRDGSGCAVSRFAPGGAPDAGFANGGVFTDPGLVECAVEAAPEGGVLVRGTTKGTDGKGLPRLLLLTASGEPSARFGDGGSVVISPSGSGEVPRGWAVAGAAFAPEGRVVVAAGGGIETAAGGVATLFGLTAGGAADPAFGSAGTVVQPVRLPSWTSPRAIAAEPDGELVVTGVTDSGSLQRHQFWMRFSAAGQLRHTASGAPLVATPTRPATQLRPVGRDNLYGLVPGPSFARFSLDGGLVDRFGRHGLAALPQGFHAASFVVDPDGGATVFGATEGRRMAVYRLTAAGRPAHDFGRHGLATLGVPGARYVRAEDGAVGPGGDIVVVGAAEQHLEMAELGPGGHLRRGFGHRGFLGCRCGGTRPAHAHVLLHRGSIYVIAHSATAGGEATDLVKVDAAGRLDRSFAGGGHRRVPIGDSAIALFARGGRLLVVGQEGYFQGPAQVRAFRLDGAPDRSYRQGATLVAGGNEGSAHIVAAQQPDGRLVLVGEQRPAREAEGSRLELLGLR
jgi:uncharacterized delta-60 repeat protein